MRREIGRWTRRSDNHHGRRRDGRREHGGRGGRLVVHRHDGRDVRLALRVERVAGRGRARRHHDGEGAHCEEQLAQLDAENSHCGLEAKQSKA